MNTEQKLKFLKDKLVGRTELYGLQNSNGTYVAVRSELTDEVLIGHIEGKHTVGAYQVDKDNKIKYMKITWINSRNCIVMYT